MKTINTGGPVHPCKWRNEGDTNAIAPDGQVVPPEASVNLTGISMRDHFAGQALKGMLSASREFTIEAEGNREANTWVDFAKCAYEAADAMLAARGAA